MTDYAYHLVDVFTETPFGGNQLAVFPDGDGLSAERMQQIARELNLSETVFVLPPTDPANHARLRIFTPRVELPVAGHPTIGTGYVLRRLGILPADGAYRLEEQVGVIPIDVRAQGDDQIQVTMEQPIPSLGAIFADRDTLAELLTLSPADLLDRPAQVVSAGVPFLFIPLRSVEALGRVRLRLDIWERVLQSFVAPHVFTFAPTGGPTLRSRMFAPAMGIPEDPATGIASGPLGVYALHYGLIAPTDALHIVNLQGVEMGRPSAIQIAIEGQIPDAITRVTIGGLTQPVGRGVLSLP